MENEIIEFDIGLGGGFVERDGDGDASALEIDPQSDAADMSDSGHTDEDDLVAAGNIEPYVNEGYLLDLEPSEGMEFESEEAAKSFYNSYARRIGFSTRVSSSRRARRDGAIIQRQFVCAKEGFRNENEKRSMGREIKRPRIVTRVGCKASLCVKMQDSGKWIVIGFVTEHNHELVPLDQVHCLRSHRQISGPAKTLIDTLQAAGWGPRKIMSALIQEYGGISKVGFTEVDCRNYMRNSRQKSLEGDVQILLDYLKQMKNGSSDFFYAVQGSDDHYTGNVFWADGKARRNYAYFGDTVTFDTVYRSNRYRLPLSSFTGMNHHGQPVLFGCAFLLNETEASFVWLFNTWLAAMYDRAPVSISTDHDAAIGSAVGQVFPNTHHRFCKWHVFKQCQEKLSHMFLEHPNFEADLHKCVNLAETVEEFESSWWLLVDRYDIRHHEWLQMLYSSRSHWVPAYLKDTFFAEISTTHRSDSMNSYFDGYINASTNLSQFVKLYEKANDSRMEREVKADHDTINTCPILKTPSPMERQASDLYTRKIFLRFQEELVGTLTFMACKVEGDDKNATFHVSKFGEDHKVYNVELNFVGMKASCSCRMFEFSGLLCRHVLAVFRVTNVLSLPSFYILKRWTRNAKSKISLECHSTSAYNNYLESHTVRYNTLRQEALKLVNEAAKSLETYHMAMNALHDAAQRVAHATTSVNILVNSHSSRSLASCRIGRNYSLRNDPGWAWQHSSKDCEDDDDEGNRIQRLTRELEDSNRRCQAYRSNLFSVLKLIEDHKLKLSVNVQNILIAVKDSIM